MAQEAEHPVDLVVQAEAQADSEVQVAAQVDSGQAEDLEDSAQEVSIQDMEEHRMNCHWSWGILETLMHPRSLTYETYQTRSANLMASLEARVGKVCSRDI